MKHSAQTLQPTLPPTLLSSQQQIYQAIARASNDAMMIAAPTAQSSAELSPEELTPEELTIVYVNEAFTRLTGYLAEEVTGNPLTFLSKCSAAAGDLTPVWQSLAQEHAMNQPWRCVTKTGVEKPTELALVPFVDKSGFFSFLVTIHALSASEPATSFPPDTLAISQRFIDSLHLSIAVLDRSKMMVAVSKQVQRRCREIYNFDLVAGQPLTKAIQELTDPKFDENFAKALEGHYLRCEHTAAQLQQESLWYALTYAPLRDQTGKVEFVVLIVNDITTSRETEEALALSLQRYALATKNAKAGIWDWDLETNELYIDPSAQALLGFSEEDYPSNLDLWEKNIHPDDHDYVVAATYDHVAGLTDELRVEYRVLHKDGSYRWLFVAAKASRDQNNRALRVVGTSVDITEQKIVVAALHRSEGRFQAVWDASPDAMVLSDEAGNVILANPAYYALCGYAPAEVIGKPFELNFPQEFQSVAPRQYMTLFETGILPKHQVSQLRSADGEWKTVEISAEFVRQEGQPVAMFSTLRDITERSETEATLKRHPRYAEALTDCSQLVLKSAPDIDTQVECLKATLNTLLRGLDAEYLALYKAAPEPGSSTNGFCIEVVAPQLREAARSKASTPSSSGVHLAESLEQRLAENRRISAASDEVTTGLLSGTFHSFHLERLAINSGLWGYIIFGMREVRCEWKSEEQWFIQTAAEMIGNVIQRWEAEGAVRVAQATLEQQVQQRTAMLFQTVESLQRQIRERRRAEVEVRRRLNVERALRDISARLMRETNFDHAAAATLADIGEKLIATKIILLRLQPEGDSFTGSHTWAKAGVQPPAQLIKLAAKTLPRLLKHLRKAGYLLVSKPLSTDLTDFVEITPFQDWFSESLLLLPLNVSDELVGLLLCCDAEHLQDDKEEGLHFVQAAVGMLSAMLRIDQMMNALERRVAEQTEELAAFFNMAVLASGSEHMTETLAAALTMVREIGNCDAVCVHILSPDGASLQLAYQVGLDDVDHRHILRLARESVLYQRIQRTSTPILVTELNPTKLEAHVDEFQTYLGAPMVVRNNVQGLLSCYWRFVHSVSLNQMSLLTALTDQLGIILENQRLHRHAQEAGVIHERQRLARELHDSVTQSMYGVMIFARAGREALEDNDFERLSDCLAQVEGGSLRSLKEMRLLLYQLRPLALESQGVVEAIRNRLELVEHRLGIEVDMQLTSIIGLSHEVEETLYHVAMEALNNILKHADADRVSIQLLLIGDHAELRVSDDGVGFTLEEVNQGMGLNNMRDRINAVGGDLQILTQVDAGTTILVRIPIT